MHLSDLFQVLAYVIALYTLVMVFANRQHLLLRVINPNRRLMLIGAVSAFATGITFLQRGSKSWALAEWGEELSTLVTEKPISIPAKFASVALILGLLFLVLYVWCWVTLPRDPSTFGSASERQHAVRYYTCWKGGHDYALLVRVRPGADGGGLHAVPEAEAWDAVQIQKRLPELPAERTIDAQIGYWRELAAELHASMKGLDAITAVAQQGPNRRVFLDAEYGGFFFVYIRPPGPAGECLYLFAATLDQGRINDEAADHRVAMLTRALQNIESSVHC
jgi:hypothetical protein